MARIGYNLAAQLNSDAAYERELAAIKRVKGWVEVPFRWQTKQTFKAVQFPVIGWVPRVAIAGRRPDGRIVPWSQFRNSTDVFLLADWLVASKQKEGVAI